MTSSSRRNLLFGTITIAFFLLITEIGLRLALKISKDYPFWRPDLAYQKHYYFETDRLLDSTIRQNDGVFDILFLGGSVVADEWRSTVARRVQEKLRTRTGNPNIRYWNVANLGHSSIDNLNKYRLLENQRFDLVLYYEAINETRLNNIPRPHFRADYRHYHWYDEVALVGEHPEMPFTVIPFTLHLVAHRLAGVLGFRKFINEAPDPDDQKNGGDLKTPPVYATNLETLRQLAEQRGEPLVFVNFTYYIPEQWRKSGFQPGKTDYSPCDLSSPIETWGLPQNVEKGMLAHRVKMQELAKAHPEVAYFDMHPRMPKAGRYFCDICHLTQEGCEVFADTLVHFLEPRLKKLPTYQAMNQRPAR